MKLREAAPAAGVFVLALAWLLLLRPYGFQLEDEGTLLSWFDRVVRGQRSYFDFHTGYTPGLFALGSAVFDTFGTTATAMRGVLAVINALSAAALTEITRRVAGTWLAPIPALLWLAFVPLYVGEFAAFNIPYPTWPATLAWTVVTLAMLAWVRGPRTPYLVMAGLAAAAAMWVRPNAGALSLAGATWVVAAFAARTTIVDLAAATAAAAAMALGVWYTFAFQVWGVDPFVHLLPAFTISVLYGAAVGGKLLVPPETRGPALGPVVQAPRATTSLFVLAAAFLVPTLAWMAPLFSELGLERFLYEVFLVGADYQSLYFKPHPAPEPFAVLVVLSLLVAAAAGRLVGTGRAKPVPLLVAGLLGGSAVVVFLLGRMVAPEGLAHSVVLQLENASFWLAATTSFGLLAWLWKVPPRALLHSGRARALAAVAPLAVAMYAQMFPRSDFMHQIQAVPLLAVAACGLLAHVCSWWARGAWPAGWNGGAAVRVAVWSVSAVVLAVAFADKMTGPLEARKDGAPRGGVSERLDVRVEAAAGDELEAIQDAASFLRDRTTEGEKLWSFPATSGVLFAAGRTNVAPHDYWYPGRPDREEEQRVLALLRDTKPRFIVTLNRGWHFFSGAPGYFDGLRRFARQDYKLVARYGRYDVLERRDGAAGDDILSRSEPRPATLEDVLQPNLERRRQAAARWMETLTPQEAATARLPSDRRDAILLMRALRDGGDMRAAGWAIAGFQSPDPRIRREAADAMAAMVRALDDDEAGFAVEGAEPVRLEFVEPWLRRAEALEGFPEAAPFVSRLRKLVSDLRASEAGY
jgi:hypothetical protein